MKVLYMVFQALLGGHVMSAYTVSRKMSDLGYDCVFAGGEGALTEDIRRIMPFEEVTIPLYHKGRQTYFTWESFDAVTRIREIVKTHGIELIHAFDSRSYVNSYLAALREDIPLVCTLCGGEDPYYNLPVTSTIAVFSEEQRMKLVQKYRWSEKRVVVNRARMDLEELDDPKNVMDEKEWSSYGLSLEVPVVATVSSFDSSKELMIKQLSAAIETVVARGIPCQFALVGGSGPRFEETVRWAEALNARVGERRVVMTGPVKRAFRLLKRASVVIGSGRAAFEGMCYSVPVMIVGAKGYAGDVREEEIDQIAYYNFSGRNLAQEKPVEAIADRLATLLQNPAERRVVGEFGRRFLVNELDVIKGCERYAVMYEQAIREHRDLTKARKLLSFGKCSVPIWMDNFTHEIRQYAGV